LIKSGVNLVVTKSTVNETVPILGSRAPIKINQNSNPTVDETGIFFTEEYSQTQAYGIIFAIQEHINSGITKNILMTTQNGSRVGSTTPLRHLGTLNHYGKKYEYYLGRVAANTSTNAKAKNYRLT
jgi:hypothetical protein